MIALLLVALLAAPGIPKVAVTDVQDVSGKDGTLAKSLTQIVVGEVTAANRFRVVSSAEIAQLLGLERQRQLLGCSESGCLAEIGGALGVDYLLTSQLSRVGSRYRLDLRLVDARKAAVVASVGDFVPATEDGAADGAQRLVRELIAAPGVPGAPPRAQADSTLAASAPAPAPGHGLGPKLAFGAAGALGAAAAVLGVLAASSYSGLHDAALEPTRAHYDALASSTRTRGDVADALLAGAIVAGGVGTYLWFSAAPAPGGGGEVAVGGHF